MTTVHINQPRFLPALNYLQRMLIADIFVYRDDVQFAPKDWENRNKIKTRDGWIWLTVPVRSHHGIPINDVEIDNTVPRWRGKIIQSIICNYARAPYYAEFMPTFEELLSKDWKRLVDLNYAIIHFFRTAWRMYERDGVKTKFVFASQLGCEGDTDEILIAMCKKLGATTYLSGAEGRNYNRLHRWDEEGIRLRYHDYTYPEYPQQHGDFLPWLCALDLLLNCGGLNGRKYLEQPMTSES